MYHYTECGLSNVFLANGYEVKESPYGKVVSFHDVQGLHNLIADNIVVKPGPLDKFEIKYLRTELGLSQERLSELLGVKTITFRKWESGTTTITGPSNRLLRILYSEQRDRNSDAYALVKTISALDNKVQQAKIELRLAENNNNWQTSNSEFEVCPV